MNDRINILRDLNKLNDILHEMNITQEIKEKLMRNYKKQLDMKYKLEPTKFAKILLDNEIPEEFIPVLGEKYKKQLRTKEPIIIRKYDSILFLSSISNLNINSIKVQGCIKSKSFNFSKCIKYLKETERLQIIKVEEYDDFIEKNKIFYDDENHFNNPKRDILYRKINNNYYVNNNEYFAKYTDYLFTLYSNILTIFDLKQITVSLHTNSEIICDTNTSLNTSIADIKYNSNSIKKGKKENSIKMEFQKHKGKSDKYHIFNNCSSLEAELEFINKEMSQRLNKIIYDPTEILNLVKNRTKNILSSFNHIVSIEILILIKSKHLYRLDLI